MIEYQLNISRLPMEIVLLSIIHSYAAQPIMRFARHLKPLLQSAVGKWIALSSGVNAERPGKRVYFYAEQRHLIKEAINLRIQDELKKRGYQRRESPVQLPGGQSVVLHQRKPSRQSLLGGHETCRPLARTRNSLVMQRSCCGE